MHDLLITGLLIVCLFLFLGSGVWIGLTLSGVAWIAMQMFVSRPAGDAMAAQDWLGRYGDPDAMRTAVGTSVTAARR